MDWPALAADFAAVWSAERDFAAGLSDMLATGPITTLAGGDANAEEVARGRAKQLDDKERTADRNAA